MAVAFALSTPPVLRASLRMGNGDDTDSILLATVNNLKGEAYNAAGLMSPVDSGKSIGICRDLVECGINRHAEATGDCRTLLRISVSGVVQFSGRLGVEVNPHRQSRASRIADF
jgi:hypothetical protein